MRLFQKHRNLKNKVASLVMVHMRNHKSHNRLLVFDKIFNFPNHFIFQILVFLEQTHDDKIFDPLYARKSHSQVGLITQ